VNKAARLWAALAAPGAFWLLFFFAVPFYAVACVAFGTVDPIFRDAIPQWNPLNWSFGEFNAVFSSVTSGPLRGVFVRTIVYVVSAMIISFAIGFPVAYYLARHAGKRRMLLLLLIIAPFWVNYLMRMLAWVNLLSPSGLFSRFVGMFGVQYNWLDGSPITVILGLVYGYIPFLILPLYSTLERLDWRLVEAARDLGATSRQAFRVVTVPMAKAGAAFSNHFSIRKFFHANELTFEAFVPCFCAVQPAVDRRLFRDLRQHSAPPISAVLCWRALLQLCRNGQRLVCLQPVAQERV
jgi:spermidine/putrescine transport system permease protein